MATTVTTYYDVAQLQDLKMPIISQFFGIIIRMFYDEHNPPHLHSEYQGEKAVFDFNGNIVKGNLKSKTATKLVFTTCSGIGNYTSSLH